MLQLAGNMLQCWFRAACRKHAVKGDREKEYAMVCVITASMVGVLDLMQHAFDSECKLWKFCKAKLAPILQADVIITSVVCRGKAFLQGQCQWFEVVDVTTYGAISTWFLAKATECGHCNLRFASLRLSNHTG
jgi:hypothetical protein